MHLGVDWNDTVLNSHTLYKENQYGHGGIQLWKPIHTGSLHSYQSLPEEVISKVYGITKSVFSDYSYDFFDGKCVISSEVEA